MRMDTTQRTTPVAVRAGLLALAAGLAMSMVGCNVDSYLDPSIQGIWEQTAKVQPVLRRLAVIEGPDDGFADVSEITANDLLPEVEEYRVGPGDVLDVTAFDLNGEGPNLMTMRVSPNGEINIPSLGQIYVSGRTLSEVEQAVEDAMTALVRNPLASIAINVPRQALYTTVGAVGASGQWPLERADLRLLDALAVAGWFPENTKEIYVIRQVPLVDAELSPRASQPTSDSSQENADSIIDVIDQLSGGGGSPGVLSNNASRRQSQPEAGTQPDPVVNLIEPDSSVSAPNQPSSGQGSWVYLNNKWVRIQSDAGAQAGRSQTTSAGSSLFTQRVIRIPVNQLLAGNADVNIIVRSGDIIRVPQASQGFFYVSGQAQRPGTFTLASEMTLIRAVDSASGLGTLAIPERVEITRMLPGDRQATMMMNYSAIIDHSQPDIYIKANDRINIGTNAWALPLAVIRNGFRATYGFGFLLDRNFGNDVFGAPPIRNF